MRAKGRREKRKPREKARRREMYFNSGKWHDMTRKRKGMKVYCSVERYGRRRKSQNE